MVTWGANQVFNLGGNSNSGNPPVPAFGSSAPAPSNAFGSAPTSNLFGSSPAPAPGGGLFGSTAPASGGGLFGSTATAPASGSTSLFGKPATSSLFGNTASAAQAPAPLFGTPTTTTSLFGTPTPASTTGGGLYGSTPTATAPAIPAQAALQAHIDAQARQEEAKLQSSLEELLHAYAGTSHSKPSPFVTIVYNNMTSEELQWQFANQQCVGVGGYSIPPKPPQVSEQTWLEAVVNNPDRTTLIPAALVGAEALQARVGWQQDVATKHEQESLKTLRAALNEVQRRHVQVRQNLQQLQQMHASIRGRMLRIMNKTEVVRCLNLPLQGDEVALAKRFHNMLQQLEKVGQSMMTLSQKEIEKKPPELDIPNDQKGRLAEVFTEHRKSLVYLSESVQKEKRDIHLLKDRLAQS